MGACSYALATRISKASIPTVGSSGSIRRQSVVLVRFQQAPFRNKFIRFDYLLSIRSTSQAGRVVTKCVAASFVHSRVSAFIAQLVEHLICNQRVVSSSLTGSLNNQIWKAGTRLVQSVERFRKKKMRFESNIGKKLS